MKNVFKLMFITLVFINIFAEDTASISLNTENPSVRVGEFVVVNITINSDEYINLGDILLEYDSTYLLPVKTDINGTEFTYDAIQNHDSDRSRFQIIRGEPHQSVPKGDNLVFCKAYFRALKEVSSTSIDVLFTEKGDSEDTAVMKDDGLATDILSSVTGTSVQITPGNLFFPMITDPTVRETKIGIINPTNNTAYIVLKGYDSSGTKISEGILSINPNNRVFGSLNNYFSTTSGIKSIVVETDGYITGWAEIDNVNDKESAAYPAITVNESKIYLPHIDEGSYWNTFLSIMNPYNQEISSTLSNQIQSSAIPGLSGPYTSYQDRVVNIFGGTLPSDLIWGDIDSQNGPVAGVELFTRVDSQHHAAALMLDGLSSKNLFFTHIDVTNFWWTGLAFCNVEYDTANVTIKAFKSDGAPVQTSGTYLGTNTMEISGKGKAVNLVENFFDNKLDPETAWIKVESDKNLVGYEIFGAKSGYSADLAAGIEAPKFGVHQLIFPVARDGIDDQWTGISILNISEVLKAKNVTLEAYDDLGTLLGTVTKDLNPGQKIVDIVRNIFNSEVMNSITWVKVKSNYPIAGFTLWGFNDQRKMHGISALY